MRNQNAIAVLAVPDGPHGSDGAFPLEEDDIAVLEEFRRFNKGDIALDGDVPLFLEVLLY